MAIIKVNDVDVTLPDIITSNSPGLEPLRIEKVAAYLQTITFHPTIIAALQSGKGELRISYTGGATPAKATNQPGGIHRGHQGGDFYRSSRAAYYQIEIDYHQFLDNTNHRLFDLRFNTTAVHSHVNHTKVDPSTISNESNKNNSEVNRQNNIPLTLFCSSNWSSASAPAVLKDKDEGNHSSEVVEAILTREKEEAEAKVKEQEERAKRIALIQKMGEDLAPIAVASQLAKWKDGKAFDFIREHYPIVAEIVNSIPSIKEMAEEEKLDAFIQKSSNIIASHLMQSGINISDMSKQEREAFIKASTHAGSMIAFHLMQEDHIEAGMGLGRGIRAIALNEGLTFEGERLNILGYSIENEPIPSMPFVENRQPVTSLQSSQSSATASSVTPNVAYQYEDNDIQAILSVRLQQLRIQNPQLLPLEILAAVDNIAGAQLENRLRQEVGNHQGARILLIPCNLGNAHWVGILLELRADGTASRAEYIDSLTTNPIVPETFQAQLQQVYPNARFQTLELLKQNDCTSCGAYTIENLLVSALKIPSPDPETIRVLHLEALRQYNPTFYNAFNERQRNNRPTTATLHEQLFHLDRLKNIWFSKQELSRILEIKKYLSVLPEEIKTALLQAFQHNTAYNDNHALHLNTIRTALEKVVQLESKALAELKQLLFDMPAQPGTLLSFRDIKFRVSYQEILAVTQCHLVPEKIRDLQQTLTEQIKQDAEFARKLQADLWSDNEVRFLSNSSSRTEPVETSENSVENEVTEHQVNPSVVVHLDNDNTREQKKPPMLAGMPISSINNPTSRIVAGEEHVIVVPNRTPREAVENAPSQTMLNSPAARAINQQPLRPANNNTQQIGKLRERSESPRR